MSESDVYQCSCGCCSLFLHRDGLLTCANCHEVITETMRMRAAEGPVWRPVATLTVIDGDKE